MLFRTRLNGHWTQCNLRLRGRRRVKVLKYGPDFSIQHVPFIMVGTAVSSIQLLNSGSQLFLVGSAGDFKYCSVTIL